MSRPWTIVHTPFSVVHGKPEMSPAGTPYEPSEHTAILAQSPAAVPSVHSRTWSSAADAADAADDAPRASSTAAPRCCTVGMKSLSIQAWSTRSLAVLPSTLAWNMSGYCVAEWLPQIVMFVTDATCTPVFAASCALARLWS